MKLFITTILLASSVFMSGCGKGMRSESNISRGPNYRDAPTYQQWQNIEAFSCFMMILGEMVNGCGSSGGFQYNDPYGRYGYYEPWMR